VGAAALEVIPSLLSITQDESEHPLIKLMAAAAVAEIDPSLVRHGSKTPVFR
jgi:hypothetical protein